MTQNIENEHSDSDEEQIENTTGAPCRNRIYYRGRTISHRGATRT